VRESAFYQVFMFAEEEHAEIFRTGSAATGCIPLRVARARWAHWSKSEI
jgi:hypothetical protein